MYLCCFPYIYIYMYRYPKDLKYLAILDMVYTHLSRR